MLNLYRNLGYLWGAGAKTNPLIGLRVTYSVSLLGWA